jgi:hypothetical protein
MMKAKKIHLIPQPSSSIRRRGGFALVVTLSMLVLLSILAVGLLSLSSVSLRASSGAHDTENARANARLALMLALGELQRHTGADTRVTARADVLDENHPPVLGAWKSWEGTNHTPTGPMAGRPVSPGNDYRAAKRSRFLAWLVSGSGGSLTDPSNVPDVRAGMGKVALVGAGSVGIGAARENLQIHLAPTPVSTGKGNGTYAWWIGGENQKVRLPKPYRPANDTVAGWSVLAKSHSTADPKVFRMDTLLMDAKPAHKTVSLRQSDLIAPKQAGLAASTEFFHDLSTTSTGLLTNTATGGWRKDFSLLTENWGKLATSNQPFFRVAPGQDLPANIPTPSNHRPDRSLLYPWAAYRAPGIPIYEHGAVSSWENLRNWATLYKTMGSGGTTITGRSYRIDSNSPGENFNFLHRVRIIPVIARVQWVFSHWAAPTVPATVPPTFEPRLLATPVVTMWNPYNVAVTSRMLRFKIAAPLPNAFRFKIGTVQNLKWNSLMPAENTDPPYQALYLTGGNADLAVTNPIVYDIPATYTFKPGETLVFSPAATPVPASGTATLQPGFRKQGGHFFPLLDDNGNKLAVPAATNVSVEAKFDTIQENGTNLGSAKGVGIYLDMEIGGVRHLVYRMVYKPEVAAVVYPTVTGLTQATLSQSSADPQPFLTTLFGARTASRTHLAAKGFLQTNPLVNYTVMGFKDTVEYNIQWDYPGTDHPVNSPFDYSFEKLSGAGGDTYPNSNAANQGFIISGFQSADGLNRCIIAELPTKPVQSLAELQNWDMRYENPIPPYAFNIIGNSGATPLLPANAVFNAANASLGQRDLQHDDFYCANHVLFDDWFVSSIAPKTSGLGAPGSSETLKKTFTDFVSGTDPLPNRAYQTIPADAAAAQTAAGAEKLFNDFADKPDSWKNIASRLEVEGMFNVNSTSVKAWRALLGHARNQKTPYVTPTGSALSGAEDYAVSRFSIAGDAAAKTIGTSGGFSAASEFAGYRKFDEKTLDRFAEEIVRQVRARGPFLSLAEFVNRQLSSGDLALAGTIQAALNALAKDPSLNPYAEIQSRSKPSSANPLPAASAQYQFPDAALGHNAYGLPGWTRQADVLRPLAPILSARDDTFTIRAYGDARDASGRITARATCEAVVRRSRDYVDPSDSPETTSLPVAAANLTFGRRYQIISFRWLKDSEI